MLAQGGDGAHGRLAAGPVRALLPPVTVPGREPAMGAVPALGQHTDSVLAEIRGTQEQTVTTRSGRTS